MEKFKGFPYPVLKKATGYWGHTSGVDQIKADLLILLLTSPGERVMLPDYGTPLKDLIFDPNDALLAARARQMIVDSITRWEPRIAVQDISVQVGGDRATLDRNDDLTETEAVLLIRIHFRDPDNITEIHELALDIPLPGQS